MNEINGTYQAAIHPGRINIWYEPQNRRSIERSKNIVPNQFRDNSHNGKISKVAERKITQAVNYLTYMCPKKKYYHTPAGGSGNYFLNFITLTLSSKQIHSDNEIKRNLLEPFLNECRKRYKVANYIWRAERQANGNIHFHILSDRFIWWNDLRNTWNYFQERLGYVSRYRLAMRSIYKEGFQGFKSSQDKRTIPQLRSAWEQGVRTDWSSPNSTDVHSLKNLVSIRSYVIKYIIKTDENQPIQGRMWGCSYELTNLTGAREFADGSLAPDIDKLVGSLMTKIYKGDYYTVIYFTRKILNELLCFEIISSLDTYLRSKFKNYQPPDLFSQAA
jgi:hypothetical protein